MAIKQEIFSSEEPRSVEEIGKFLINIGEKLVNDGSFSLRRGEEDLVITPTGIVILELEYKTKGEKHEFEIEIEWKPGAREVTVE